MSKQKPVWSTYTFHIATGPFWWRVRVAISILLTPFTIILFGKSITVKHRQEERSDEQAN